MITRRRALRAVLVLFVAALAGNLLVRRMKPPAAPPLPPVRTAVSIPSGRTLDSFALSPDGATLVYAAEWQDGRLHLVVRRVGSADERELTEATGAHDPFFSPDGLSVGYFARDALWRISVTGGPAVRICAAPGDSAGATWTDEGRIVFAPLGGQGLAVVSSGGGSPGQLTKLNARDGELAHGWPHALPGGAILFTVSQRSRDPHLETLSRDGQRGGRLLPAIGPAQFTAGRIVYGYLGDLYAAPFDAEERKVTGAPTAFARGVRTGAGFDQLGRTTFAVSLGGTLAWVRSEAGDGVSELVKVSTSGVSMPLGGQAARYQTPRLSPDGRHLAVVVSSGMMARDILVLEMAHPDRVVNTIRGGDNQSPAWTPDGRLSFASNREGLQKIYVTAGRDFRREAARTTLPLFSMDVQSPRNPSSWVKRPPLLAFYEIDPFRARDVMIYRLGEAVFPVAATAANERSPVLSPDGQSIAWVSDASGRDEVYVRKLNSGEEPTAITRNGGVEPVWSAGGLVYREGDRLMRDGVMLFEGRFEKDAGGNAADYDIDAGGKFFVMLKSAGRPKEIRVVTNWSP